jgi:hypothetical protein
MRNQFMRKWVDDEIEQLRELVDLLEDGLLVVDPLRDGDPQPAFRTLVQLDGDVMSSIAAWALSDPEFAQAHARHIEHLGQLLRAHTERLRRRARWVSMAMSSSGATVAGVGSYSSGLSLQLADASWELMVSGAGGFIAGVAIWPLGRMVLHGLIAWRRGHDRRGRTHSVLDRLAKHGASTVA